MLAQMGQMMQLRSAQQEYEGQNALRDAFASGGDFSDPAFLQRVRQANPKMAFDLEAKYLTGQKTRTEMLGTAYKNSKEFLTLVNSPEGLRDYTISQFSDPIIGPSLRARGITPEKALANLDKEIATSGFSTVLKKSALGLDNFIKEEMQTDRSRISAAPGHRQASVAEQRFKNELDFGGESKPFLIQDPNNPSRTIEVEHRRDKRTGQWVPMAIQPPPLSVNISPSSATATPVAGGVPNTLATAVGAAPVNASSPNMLGQNAAPVVAANVPAPALATVRGAAPVFKDIVDPTNEKRMITINVNEYKGGTIDSKGNRAPGVIGIAGKEPTAALREQRTIGAEDALKSELDNLRFAYGKLNEAKAIPSTERSGISNLSSSTQASDTGQFFGKVFGTTEQSLRDNIQSSNLRLLQSIKNATGMSAQELNSNMELKTWIDSLTNPKTAYETNIKNIDNIENFVKKRANRNAESSAPSVDASAPKVIKSEAEYNALPSGATYIDPDGVSRRKR
jgi:hypothetical protein